MCICNITVPVRGRATDRRTVVRPTVGSASTPVTPTHRVYRPTSTWHTQTAKTCVRGINSLPTVSWTIKSLKTGFGQTQKTAAPRCAAPVPLIISTQCFVSPRSCLLNCLSLRSYVLVLTYTLRLSFHYSQLSSTHLVRSDRSFTLFHFATHSNWQLSKHS